MEETKEVFIGREDGPIPGATTITKLADDHWRYVESVLVTHDVPKSVVSLLGFHYRTAFIHGYKHGQEDSKDQVMIDVLDHPLTSFFCAVIAEYERGLNKYGDWSNLDDEIQRNAVKSECLEWEAASLKTVDGARREIEELTHLANTCGKRFNELTKKVDG